MIKDKLMKALKTAAADYNGGMDANMAVACAAEAWDFNEKQAERLVEMFNTALVLNKEKDDKDPAGSCELAEKQAVAKILMKDTGVTKSASSPSFDEQYAFYAGNPSKTNPSIEARKSGFRSMQKAASSEADQVPEEMNVSQRSLYKIIEDRICQIKSASGAADDVVRSLRMSIDEKVVKIAKEIESPWSDSRMADMFKAACKSDNVVRLVSEYSTKVAESDGGEFAKRNVFDSSMVDHLLKVASEIDEETRMVSEYESKRDNLMKKASEAEDRVLKAAGFSKKAAEAGSLGDFFQEGHRLVAYKQEPVEKESSSSDVNIIMKLAEIVRESPVAPDDVAKIAESLEKDAAFSFSTVFSRDAKSIPGAFAPGGIDNEQKIVMNLRRGILLADLMSNDPIIRDADPDTVAEAYRTMVMTSPRVSLDKAQVRAFLRSAVNSVAISPSDAKVLAEVDEGVSLSNINRLTSMDSSIKDSNV